MIHNARVTFSNKRIFGKFAGDNIVAVSEGVKRNLINYFGIEQRKIRVIYNGIAIEKPTEVRMRRIRTETKLCEKARVISVIGRIAEQKGHTYLIEALPDVIERFPTLKILIVGEEDFGEGGLKRKLQARAQSLKVRDKVEFLGHQEDIAAFIGISEFTVLPSLREGLPGAAIESLLLGKPVVATDVGGTSEIIANMINGILIEPRNPKMLADAICYMLSHRDEVKRMGERGKKLAEGKFTIPRMLREYSEYYLSLLCGDQLGCARIDR
jgi:glycosyltransferase involved in cell wall biosynthesis